MENVRSTYKVIVELNKIHVHVRLDDGSNTPLVTPCL